MEDPEKNDPEPSTGQELAQLLRRLPRLLPLLLITALLAGLLVGRTDLFPEKSLSNNPPVAEHIGFKVPEPTPEPEPVAPKEPAPAPAKPLTPAPVAGSATVSAPKASGAKPAPTTVTTAAKPASPVTPATAPATPVAPVVPVDWSKTKITAPIDGAYVAVFLSRKVIALVKGQQYIRVYYNAAVPADIVNPKSARNDKRAPQGDYYITKHELDNKVMTLILSYPAPADGQKALAAGRISQPQLAAIEKAYKERALPPQTTALGNTVSIRGDGAAKASGHNFAITPEQMEELWLATRKGTPVRIVK